MKGVQQRGKTVLLTTHFMDEAEYLCNRIGIMDRGKIIALDTPQNLIRNLDAGHKVMFDVDQSHNFSPLTDNPSITRVEQQDRAITVHGNGDTLVNDTIAYLAQQGCRYSNLQTAQPNLEDVFLALTGKRLE